MQAQKIKELMSYEFKERVIRQNYGELEKMASPVFKSKQHSIHTEAQDKLAERREI